MENSAAGRPVPAAAEPGTKPHPGTEPESGAEPDSGSRSEGGAALEPAFEACALGVRYRLAQGNALEGVSFSVRRGSLYAVLGPNGSGKSTLMRALLGLVRAAAGEARVAGRPVGSWGRRELAREVGAVAQSEAVTFPVTVRELVGMGRYPHLGPLAAETDADKEAVRWALERCDAVGLERRPVTTLSGGEFQRVRIARALAQEPRSLALDEPTASLDVGHEMSILGLLRRAADGGTTVLLVTHNLDLAARFADRMLLLERGQVAVEGTPAEVMREDVLSRVYGWPLGVEKDPVTGAPRATPLAR